MKAEESDVVVLWEHVLFQMTGGLVSSLKPSYSLAYHSSEWDKHDPEPWLLVVINNSAYL